MPETRPAWLNCTAPQVAAPSRQFPASPFGFDEVILIDTPRPRIQGTVRMATPDDLPALENVMRSVNYRGLSLTRAGMAIDTLKLAARSRL